MNREKLETLYAEMQESALEYGKLSPRFLDLLDDLVCHHDKLDVYILIGDEDDEKSITHHIGTYDAYEIQELEINSRIYKEPFKITIERHI